MTTDSETTEQYLTFVRSRFLIYVLVFVSRDYELGSGDIDSVCNYIRQVAAAFSFGGYRQSPYGDNFYFLQ